MAKKSKARAPTKTKPTRRVPTKARTPKPAQPSAVVKPLTKPKPAPSQPVDLGDTVGGRRPPSVQNP